MSTQENNPSEIHSVEQMKELEKALTNAAQAFIDVIEAIVPNGEPDSSERKMKELALSKIPECVMWACASLRQRPIVL